jgi:hypothetical protein
MREREGRTVDVALLCVAKAVVTACVVALGFTHVSDDDYARVVIAETFAHAPRLDPTGTSWLPFPFWLYGGAMLAFGRSLGVATALAGVLGVATTPAPYLAARAAGVERTTALVGTLLATTLPWSAWTGAAPIPEMPTAALIAAAALLCACPRVPWAAAVCALAAALSRYEAWPVCAVVACAAMARGRRFQVAALAALGPLAWMAWNAYAHHDALHFVARVSAYRQSLGAASIPLADKLLGNPVALVRGAPFAAVLAAVGAAAAVASREQRARWAWPLACAAATVAFLVYGDLRDGAPTHHPDRALLGVWWILVLFGADGARLAVMGAWRRVPRGLVVGGTAAAAAAMLGFSVGGWPGYPGRVGDEARAAQVARGYLLRTRGAQHLAVTPCAYEHFAVLAAFGAPERATVAPATHAPVTPLCPGVVVRD